MNHSVPPVAPAHLVAALRRQEELRPGRRAFVFLADGEVEAERLTYRALDRRARAVAALLQHHGGEGERVLLLLPPGLDFVAAFFGCLYAGAVAVPAYPPSSPRSLPRLRAIARDASPRLVLTRADGRARLRRTASGVPELDGLPWLAVEEARREGEWREPAVDAGTLAFLQYTSGSTAEPKGVMVSHGNLLANGAAIARAVGLSEKDVLLSWLPLYHDMGLIGIVIQSVLLGARCVLMSPTAFLQRPMRWPQAVARWGATLSGGPDFAWDLCVRRSTPEERAGLDLRRWRVAFNGAEPVRAETLDRFAQAFAPAGFRAAALCPCYGLAEATLLVSVAAPGVPPVVRERRAGSGTVAPGTVVAIVDPRSRRRLGEGREGEIWVAGPQVAAGYWRQPRETARTFRARLAGEDGTWLRTGDLGFLASGELFVTGRIKDLIVLRGRNLHPQDVERTAEASHPGFAPNGAAAFPIEAGGRERLAVALEVGRRFHREEVAEAIAALRRAVAEEHEAEVYGVALLAPGALPRTSSGKVRRRACRDGFLARTLTAVAWDVGAEEGAEALSGIQAAVARALGRPVDETAMHRPLAALGLDSLGAIELQHALETGFGIVLSVPELLAASLAELGRPHPPGPPLPVPPDLPPRERGELSYGQRALWFLHRLDPMGTAYHVAFAAWVMGGVDTDRLAQAVAALVERHDVLRTVYSDEPWAEVIAAPESFAVIDVDGALRERVAAEAARPFDLAAGPVLRVRLFRAPEGQALLVAAHHIAVDLWSLVVLMDELGRLLADPAVELPAAGSFADCVAAERGRIAGPEGDRLWEFWRERLGGRELPVLDLPTDHPRSDVARFRGAALPLTVEPETVAALKEVAAEAGTTLFTELLAAFQLLLARLAGQEEVVVGVPAAGRGRPELAGVVGYLVNPLALRGGPAGDPTGWELLARAREEALGALAHQDFPFPLLVERLQPRRNPGRTPIFQVLFALERPQRLVPEEVAPFILGLPAETVLRLGPLALAPMPLGLPGAQLELGLTLVERRGGLAGVLRYDSDLFDAATAARWAGCFTVLLAGLAEQPGARSAEIPLLSEVERRQLLAPAEPAPAASVYGRFVAQAARTPDAPALFWESREVTYRELLARAGQVAASLARRGVGPESRVGVLLPRTPDLVAAILGVLHCGAAYVPLDPAYPRERLDWMVADAQAAEVLSQFPAVKDAVPPPAPGGPDRLFAVIYTSGSTGKPKGVAIAERGVAALLAWAEQAFSDAEVAGVLASTSVCFDLSIFELFVPLTRGGAVVLAENALELPRERVTLVNTVPSAATELVRAALLPDSVRTINLAGEPFPAPLVRALAVPGRRLLNLYGPTETTVYSTWEEVVEGEGAPPIGRPLPGERALVLDARMQPLPAGVPGELWIGGAGVARGYLGRPDITAERFVPDPWGAPGARLYRTGDRVRLLPDGRLSYLGRVDHQVKIRGFRIEPGEVEAVLASHPAVEEVAVAAQPEPGGGRRLAAYVVGTIEGLRAYLEERLPSFLVPAVFVQLPALPRTANGKLDRTALPNPIGEPERSASAAPRTPVEQVLAGMWAELLGRAPGPQDDFFALGGHSLLAARLASRVREAFQVEIPLDLLFRAPTLERLAGEVSRLIAEGSSDLPPLTAAPRGGALPFKLNRVGLPASSEDVRMPVEERLARMWTELLGRAPGPQDNFFVLGGHSLLAARLASRVREAFQVEIPLALLFRSPTLERLAGEVSRLIAEGSCGLPPLPAAPRDGALPLTFAQQRLWFLDRLEPGSPRYNMPLALHLDGPLDAAALARAMAEVVGRHEALRTHFAEDEAGPVQEIDPAFHLPLPFVDLAGLPPPSRAAEAGRLAAAEARRPFDLARGPVLRATLLRRSATEHTLLLVVHHIAADAWSLALVLGELAALLRGEPLARPALQIADVAVWQRSWLRGEALATRLDAARARLAGTPDLDLPTDRPRPAVQGWHGGQRPVALPAPLSEAIGALGRQLGATPFMVLGAAFAALLGRWSGQEDFALGVPVAGRDPVETEGVVGLLVNTLALRADLSGEPSFAALVARLREELLAAHAQRDLPFDRLVEALVRERDLSRAPLCQAMLSLVDVPRPDLDLPGLATRIEEIPAGVAKLDLTLDLSPRDGGFAGALEFSADLFDPTTAERLANGFLTLLGGALAAPDLPWTRLPVLGEAERHQLLREWRGGSLEPAGFLSLPAVVHRWAVQRPTAPAVVTEDGRVLTWSGLVERSGRLARRLAGCGVGPESIVGVRIERSPELAVALLAVLEAGGAFLPLDPAHPPARLADLLADAGARWLLVRAGDPPLDGPWETLKVEDDGPAAPVPAGIDPQQAAYVIYTSGSTGRPKGVVVPHRALAGLCRAVEERYGLTPHDRVLAFASPAFDVMVEELMATWSAGAAVVPAPPAATASLDGFLRCLTATGVTVVNVSATFWHAWVADLATAPPPPALRLLVTGNERLAPDKVEAWLRETRIRLLNAYGVTEAAVTSTVHELTEAAGAIPIGRPLAHAEALVLDRRGEPVPVGVPGELALGGPGLARGYLGRPALTAERFVPHAGERLYRTGDLARFRSDGVLELFGRLDHQIKVRGVRIEPGEVEAALEAHPRVARAVVAVPASGGRLAAWVVPRGEAPPDPADLRAFLAACLPAAMLPAAWVFLDALPLTPSGKVDRRALPAPPPAVTGEGTAPRTSAEAVLAEVWSRVLDVETVGVDDNFFALGGDSILTLQVVAGARARGLAVTPRQVFEHPTIAGLAAVAVPAVVEEREEDDEDGPFELTPIQRWFFSLEQPEPQHFNQSLLVDPHPRPLSHPHSRTPGRGERDDDQLPIQPAPLLSIAGAADGEDVGAASTPLSRGIGSAVGRGVGGEGLLARHDALRLRFERGPDGWRQRVAAAESANVFTCIDLTALPAARRPAALAGAVAAAQTGFDLAAGPLFRAVLLRMGEEDRLLLAAHHLVVDGVSWRVLLADLDDPSGGATTSFRRWARLLAEHGRSAAVQEDLPRWLAAAPHALAPDAAHLLTSLARGMAGEPGREGEAVTVSVELSAANTAELLREVHAAWRARPDEALLAALLAAVGRLWVEVEGHGREADLFPGVDLERTVGWFTALFPVLLELPASGAASPGAVLRAVKERLRTVPGRGLSWGLLRYGGGAAEQALAALPRPAISFNYLGRLDGAAPFALAPEDPGPQRSPAARRTHRLEVRALVLDGRLRMDWTCDPGDRPAVQALTAAVTDQLAALLAHCRTAAAGGFTPSDFPLAGLDQETLDRLLGTDRSVEDVYPLTPAQQGILLHDREAPDSGAYVEQVTWIFAGGFDRPAFERAWSRVTARHPVLRTAFPNGEEPVQVVRRGVEPEWETEDWRHLSHAEQEKRLAARLVADRRRGFDPARAPLQRLILLRRSDDRWQLVWSHHHLLLDGWSMALVLEELLLAYEAFVRGEEPALPPRLPFRAHVERLLQRGDDEERAFWQAHLAGFAEPTPLGIDRPAVRLASTEEVYGKRRLALPGEVGAELLALGRRRGWTPATLVHAAWAVLLGFYAGVEDLVFGTVASGRTQPGSENIVGLLANTLPVRIGLSAATPLASWLDGLQALLLDVRQREATPLPAIRAWSEVPRDRPLFESLVVYENFPLGETLQRWRAGAQVEEVRAIDRTYYPLCLVAALDPDLTLTLLFARGRFEAAAVDRLEGHLATLLAGMVVGEDRPLSALPLLTPDEAAQIAAWSSGGPGAGDGPTVVELVAAQAARTPGSIAVLSTGEGGAALTYRELEERAEELAGRLRTLGVGPEVPVALCIDRSLDAVVGLLGILKAGGCCVPVDPAYPQERRDLMLDDARPAVLLTRDGPIPRALTPVPSPAPPEPPSPGEGRPHTPESKSPPLPGRGEGGRERGPGGEGLEALAYVIYTSGSTGRPKGVAVPHRVLRNMVVWQMTTGTAQGPRRTLQFAPWSFDVCMQEIFSTLGSGGTLVLLREEHRADGPRLWRLIEEEGIERLFLPFVALDLLAESAPERPLASRLAEVATAGEQLRITPAVSRLFTRLPGCALVNHYGPSECHTGTCFPLAGPAAGWPALPPIGRAIAGARIALLDPWLRPVPVGVAGEVCLGGIVVGRGYLGRPDLTAERFVPDPAAPADQPGARLYRTGDLGRWRADGEIEYLGRRDNQIKVRGVRIEPGEVEAALATHPAVLRAVVVARRDPAGARLLAAVVPRPGILGTMANDLPAELRSFLRGRLPAPMVPADVLVCSTLPSTPSGKVDRRAVAALRPARSAARTPPGTDLERELAAMWADLLQVGEVGLEDGFFELGGHSLLAGRLLARVRAALGVELSLPVLMEDPTLRGMAAAVTTALVEAAEEPELDRLLDLLDGLDEAEAERLLAGEGEGR